MVGVLLVLLFQLWNWDSQQDQTDSVADNTQNSQTEQTPDITTEPEPEKPVFPFEISLPKGATGPVETKGGYKYTFSDGATMIVYPEGLSANSTDVTWSHTENSEGMLVVGELPTSLCGLGTTNCAAGNGSIDITSRPASGETNKYVIVIADKNVATKTFEQAQTEYKDIIETIKVNK